MRKGGRLDVPIAASVSLVPRPECWAGQLNCSKRERPVFPLHCRAAIDAHAALNHNDGVGAPTGRLNLVQIRLHSLRSLQVRLSSCATFG